MKIALFGATGLSGVAVLGEALKRGHDVKVLARDPAAITTKHERLSVVRGNALVSEDVESVLQGREAVVHCLGVGGKGDGKPSTLVSDSISLLLPVMAKHGIKRLVAMSNVGAGNSGPWLVNRVVFPLFFRWLRPIIDDKNRMEAILRASSCDWTAARFPEIVDGEARSIKTSLDGKKLSFKITTASVAVFMLDQLADPTFIGATPAASN